MLPANWVDRIFAYMSALYGRKFIDLWDGTDLNAVKALWAEKLAGFADNPEAIKLALNALDDKPWPPTLPEFLGLCRDAARRQQPKTLSLGHKLTDEEIDRNRDRLRKLITDLALGMDANHA